MTSAIVQMEVGITALAIYTCSVLESSHTHSFTAVHTLDYFSWRYAHSLSMFCFPWCTLLPIIGRTLIRKGHLPESTNMSTSVQK